MSERTHFGFEQVAVDEKAQRVRGVFDSVATPYDLMNDVMSAGLHRLWKRFAVNATGVRAGMRVLDLAGGTGDLARLFADRVGPTGEVVLTDINGAMLACGRDRLLDAELEAHVAGEERLPRVADRVEPDEPRAARMHADDLLVVGPGRHHRVEVSRLERVVERERGILRRRVDRGRADLGHGSIAQWAGIVERARL